MASFGKLHLLLALDNTVMPRTRVHTKLGDERCFEGIEISPWVGMLQIYVLLSSLSGLQISW